MPRKARIDLCGVASAKAHAPKALYHILVKGIDRRNIFIDVLLAGWFRKPAAFVCNSWWMGLKGYRRGGSIEEHYKPVARYVFGGRENFGWRGRDIKETEQRVLYGERIRDKRTPNRRGARIEDFGRGQIREFKERPLFPHMLLWSDSMTPQVNVGRFRKGIEIAVNQRDDISLLGVIFFEGMDYIVDFQNSAIYMWEKWLRTRRCTLTARSGVLSASCLPLCLRWVVAKTVTPLRQVSVIVGVSKSSR